jgi:hypothetical protein
VQRESVVASIAGFSVAAVVFALLFWLVDTAAVVAAVGRADPAVLLAAVGAVGCWSVAWGLALYNVFRALGLSVAVRTAVLLNAASTFSNNVTPFGQAGGEPVTAALITHTLETDYEVSLASVTSLDAINVVPSISFAALGALYYVAVTDQRLGWQPIAAALTAGLLVLAAWRYRQRIRRVAARRLRSPLGWLSALVPLVSLSTLSTRLGGFLDALDRVAASRRRLGAALCCSAAGWGCQAIALWLTVLALGSTIPLYVPVLVVPLGRVGDVFPTPGGLGGNEAINVGLLTVLTTASAPTLTAAVTIHGVGGYLLNVSIGAAAATALGARGSVSEPT